MPVKAGAPGVANTEGEDCKIEPRTPDRAAPRRRAQAEVRFLSVADVAERLAVSVRTIRRWIVSGALPVHRFGAVIRIAEVDLRAFIALHRE